jgi:inner membrane transporter RhtA
LRLVPSRFFAVFMSVHPVVAALVGTVLLGQILVVHQWVGISIIVAANAAAVLSSSGPPRPSTGDVASTGQAAPAEAVTA